MADRRSDNGDIKLKLPLVRSNAGGSGAFRALGDDELEYFVKPLNNRHGPRILIAEFVVGRLSELLDGPCCSVKKIAITADHENWQYTEDGLKLQVGIAHASSSVPGSFEKRLPLEYRDEDSNDERHAQILAFYDWCWGGDSQWMVAQTEEHKYFSHDHGWYFPPEGNDWNIDQLVASADLAHELHDDYRGIDKNAVREIAQKIDAVSDNQMIDVLSGVPTSWPATDEELETLGCFLLHRGPQVASRICAKVGV